MSEPVLYFPDDIPIMMYEGGLKFVDVVTQSPSQRRQQVRNISGDLPLSKFNIRVGAISGDSNTGVTTSTTTWQEFYDFMLAIKGRYRRFYIFDPKVRDWEDNFIRVHVDGGTSTVDNLPLTFPYKGGSEPVLDVFSAFTSPAFDQGGVGGEWRLTALTTVSVVTGYYNTEWTIGQTHKRFAVRSAAPEFPFTYDFSAADPWTEVTFQVIESDSDPVGLA
jgi:hypothetical protein